MFAGRITKDIDVGEYKVRIRKLSDLALDEAAEARVDKQIEKSKQYGAELLDVFRKSDSGKKAETDPAAEPKEPTRQQVYDRYDKRITMNKGLVSYVDPAGVTVHVQGGTSETIEAILDLDHESSEAIFHAIVDLSHPPKHEVEAARGNA